MRIALGIEYDGTDFMGWQVQPHGPSVQDAVEHAVGLVANERVAIACSGRTDAGVHARCQVGHFDTTATRTERGWVLGTNSRLPRSICVRWAATVTPTFHARHSAIARRYTYSILNRPVRPALESRYVAWERVALDVSAMHRAAQALLGENDFTSFRTVACQSRTPWRRLEEIGVTRSGEHVRISVRANAFLHHMVRNIVGSLVAVGRGERPESWIGEVLAARDRNLAAPTAPAVGLVFDGPLFPPGHGLPPEVCAPPA
ncbi:MAG TPA: tRNA pseudouridine(38-40) synthase TruA [Candidatus Saccharimonadia bacterium]|nr:tRNA pseudouridine(38-40) synthase TruA [Candidatus Saccharimonadia bacterium]